MNLAKLLKKRTDCIDPEFTTTRRIRPNWTSGKQPRPPKSNYREDSGGRRHREHVPRDGDGDRRRSGGGRSPDRRQGGRRRDQRPSRPYQPEYNVQLQPNGQAFNALIKAMRDSCRTFEL